MKKWSMVGSFIVILLFSCSCREKEQVAVNPTESEIQKESTTGNVMKPVVTEEWSSLQSQLKIMAQSMDLWKESYKSDLYYNEFAVTDLDKNGRYELIIAQMAGTGHYTDGCFFEINETYDALVECERIGKKGYGYGSVYDEESWADFIVSETAMYYDKEKDIYYYIFEDFTKDGLNWRNCCWQALYIKDGAIYEDTIVTMEASWDEKGDGTFGYWDSEGNTITEEQY